MAGTPAALKVAMLTETEWPRLRDVRLTALKDEPQAFLATYDYEATFDEDRWRQEFSRGEWNILLSDGQEIGLLGVTRLPDMPVQECYLEYLWVAPEHRRSGRASTLLRAVLDRLRNTGVHIIWLYILGGNDRATCLYQKFGFQSTGERQPLPGDPDRYEERMRLRLT